MKKVLKVSSLIALLAVSCALAGCSTSGETKTSCGAKAVQRDFNRETYVWEYFIFPTNRTEKR